MIWWIAFSLFYTPQELASLTSSESSTSSQESVCLQGISFKSSTDWNIWINGQQVRPDKAAAYGIKKVSEKKVCFQTPSINQCLEVGACSPLLFLPF